ERARNVPILKVAVGRHAASQDVVALITLGDGGAGVEAGRLTEFFGHCDEIWKLVLRILEEWLSRAISLAADLLLMVPWDIHCWTIVFEHRQEEHRLRLGDDVRRHRP